MKFKVFFIPLIYLSICIAQLQAEEFAPGTLIKIHSGYIPIEQFIVQNNISVAFHNAHPIVVPIFWGIVAVTEKIVETAIAVGTTLLGAHLAQKIAKKHRIAHTTQTTVPSNIPPKKPNNHDDDDDKYDTNKYPNGIYKDAGYHHKNSHGTKGKSPKNGQELLNNALRIEESEDAFIAVEDNYFVIFYKTIEREFHGHAREWKQLTDHMKNTFINHRLAKRSGKIIGQSIK